MDTRRVCTTLKIVPAIAMTVALTAARPTEPGPVRVEPLPNASFDAAAGPAGWTLGRGASLDRSCGAEANGCLKLAVGPAHTGTQAATQTPTKLLGWHWHRLSFSYRLSPGVSAGVSWSETDARGIVHTRRSGDRLRLAPADVFTPASLQFISRPDGTAFRLGLEARVVCKESRPGSLRVDDVRLEALRPAAACPAQPIPRAMVNHDFESPTLFGYYKTYRTARVGVVDDPTAKSGGRCLRHTAKSPRDGTHGYALVRKSFVLAYGGMYRITAWARGTGRLGVAFVCGGGWFRDWRVDPNRRAKRHAPDRWRCVQADFIIDRREFRGVRVLLLPSGNVDVDLVEIQRLR